jgi:Flp pilus assembly pilin Flp
VLRTRTRALASRRRLGSDEGAAAVEFALIFVVLMTLVFGIIEFSLILRDKVAVTSAVRAGGRTASAEPRLTGYADPATGTPSSITGLVPDAVKAVATSATGIPRQYISELWVYQAGSHGLPLSGSFANCGTNCVRYRWDPTRVWTDTDGSRYTGGFTLVSGSWAATSIDACAGQQDTVGVYLKVDHPYMFGLFGSGSIGINDSSAFRFEPIPSDPGPCT